MASTSRANQFFRRASTSTYPIRSAAPAIPGAGATAESCVFGVSPRRAFAPTPGHRHTRADATSAQCQGRPRRVAWSVAWSDVSTRRRRLAEGVAAGCYARRPVMANRGRRAGDGCTTPRSSHTTVVESNRSFSTDPHRSQPVAGPYTECQTTSQGVVESPLALNAAQPPCCEISGHPCSSIVACGHSMAVIVSPLSISTVDCTRSGGSLASSASN